MERGRPLRVPNVLPRLAFDRAFATVELPLHLNWSDRGRLLVLPAKVRAVWAPIVTGQLAKEIA